jgi:hypothetical protein
MTYAVPIGIELVEKQITSFSLVGLADSSGRSSQAIEGAQKAPVVGVAPTDVARTAPT